MEDETMSNKEVIEIIKIVNKLVEANPADELIDAYLDMITFECARWKYYKAWTLHHSNKTGKYWVTFNQ